jgi:hypothetical protein
VKHCQFAIAALVSQQVVWAEARAGFAAVLLTKKQTFRMPQLLSISFVGART